MSQNLRHALHHFWLWRKDHILSSSALSLVCSLYYHYFPIRHPLFDMAVVLVSFIFLFGTFVKDSFSWKFHQSLPLERREMYHYFIIIQYVTFLPFLVWYGLFPDMVNEYFFGHEKFSWKFSAFICLSYIVFCYVIGIFSFSTQFESIRAPYVKKNAVISSVQFVRNAIYSAVAVVSFVFAGFLVQGAFPVFFEALAKAVFNRYSFYAFVVAILVMFYLRTFRRWRREELSYFKHNFRLRRDGPLMVSGVALLMFFFTEMESPAPRLYGKTDQPELLKAIYKKDRAKFYQLVRNKDLINQKSAKGWTPLMAAAHEGNKEFFNVLRDLGASREGKVNDKDDHSHHGLDLFLLAVDGKNSLIVSELLNEENVRSVGLYKQSALHLAAYNCTPAIMDLLIEKGADVNAINSRGDSPLHVAASHNCFGGAVSLIESGADPLIKNAKGKIAMDNVFGSRKDFKYYLYKKGRMPAGKK